MQGIHGKDPNRDLRTKAHMETNNTVKNRKNMGLKGKEGSKEIDMESDEYGCYIFLCQYRSWKNNSFKFKTMIKFEGLVSNPF